jgi:hypothetical protein
LIEHVSLSTRATNVLFLYESHDIDGDSITGTTYSPYSRSSSDKSFGFVWRPTVAATINLWF